MCVLDVYVMISMIFLCFKNLRLRNGEQAQASPVARLVWEEVSFFRILQLQESVDSLDFRNKMILLLIVFVMLYGGETMECPVPQWTSKQCGPLIDCIERKCTSLVLDQMIFIDAKVRARFAVLAMIRTLNAQYTAALRYDSF